MLGRLIDEVEPAVPRDSVVDVDDQVALVQVEEAVDGAAFVAPASHGPANLGAGEELVIADHERAGVDQMEAGADSALGQVKPAGAGQFGVGEDLAEPLDLGRVVAGDQDVFTGGGAFELGLDLGELTGEPLDALDAHVAGRLERVSGERRDRDRREANQPLEAGFDAVDAAPIFQAIEVMTALLAKVCRLDQGDPRAFGKVVDRVTEIRPDRPDRSRWPP